MALHVSVFHIKLIPFHGFEFCDGKCRRITAFCIFHEFFSLLQYLDFAYIPASAVVFKVSNNIPYFFDIAFKLGFYICFCHVFASVTLFFTSSIRLIIISEINLALPTLQRAPAFSLSVKIRTVRGHQQSPCRQVVFRQMRQSESRLGKSYVIYKMPPKIGPKYSLLQPVFCSFFASKPLHIVVDPPYLPLKPLFVIRTILSTWAKFGQLLSDDRFFILRLRTQVNRFRGMWEHIYSFHLRGNTSIKIWIHHIVSWTFFPIVLKRC